MNFICPRCKSELSFSNDLYSCLSCDRNYPVVCGIPDFRLDPDPYIAPAEDRKRGKLLAEWGRDRTYTELLDCYFSLAPDVPPDLAKRWTNHKLADIEIARLYLQETLAERGSASDSALIDVGCSSGGLLAAAHGHFRTLVGVDVALRWLVIAQLRLRKADMQAQLVCANAEYLPFPRPRVPAGDVGGRTGACARPTGRGKRSLSSLGFGREDSLPYEQPLRRRFLIRRSAFGASAIFRGRCRAGMPWGADRTSVPTGSPCGAAGSCSVSIDRPGTRTFE